MQLGDAVVHVASEFPDAGIVSPLTIGGTATVLQLEVEDVDASWARAVEAGATVGHELAETFWGERHGQITDPFGHRWNLAQHVRDVFDELTIDAVGVELLGHTGGDIGDAARVLARDRDNRHTMPPLERLSIPVNARLRTRSRRSPNTRIAIGLSARCDRR